MALYLKINSVYKLNRMFKIYLKNLLNLHIHNSVFAIFTKSIYITIVV